MKLANKVALVTGGSQGLGEAIARRFAAEGAHVAVVASSSVAKAQAVADGIQAAGGIAKPYACDVRRRAEVDAVVERVNADFGSIDIVVNAAGVFFPTAAGSSVDDDVTRMVDINLKGPWNIVNAVTPLMKAHGGGKIIGIASSAGTIGVAGYAVYCGTKAAIIMMTRALARELAPHGISVNCLAPGNTATPMNEEIRTSDKYKAMVDAMTAMTPSGRTFSDPDDMARIAVFLASEDSRTMHGSCVLADEGMTAGL